MHIDFEEILRYWADEHPAEMAYISTLACIYDQERAIYRIRMECIDRNGQRHRIVEKVDSSDLIGKSDPFAYITGIINGMYEKLQENTCKEKEKMAPETAIKVLKVLGDWILMQHAATDDDKESKRSLDEAIQIAVAALEEKIEL